MLFTGFVQGRKELVMGIIAVDVETTGIDPEFDRIIEIGAFRPETGEVFRTLVNPGRPLAPRITELTGITDEMLFGQPSEEEAMQRFLEFVGEDRILLGHNIPFDHSFLVQSMRRVGMEEITWEGIDTLKIARVLCAELPSRKLGALCEHFGLTNERAHRAFEDAMATYRIYGKLKEMGKELQLFHPVPLSFQPKKQEPMTKKQRSFLNAILLFHKLEGKYETEGLTKSEASRLIDKLILAYGRVPYRH